MEYIKFKNIFQCFTSEFRSCGIWRWGSW